MELILIPLKKAIASLDIAVAQPKNEFIRDAVIQRFEYTYELCWKFIKRDLSEDLGAESIAILSRKDLFRVAADRGMIKDPLSWFTYHKARNEISQTYNEKIAEQTYDIAVLFLQDAQALLTLLKSKYA